MFLWNEWGCILGQYISPWSLMLGTFWVARCAFSPKCAASFSVWSMKHHFSAFGRMCKRTFFAQRTIFADVISVMWTCSLAFSSHRLLCELRWSINGFLASLRWCWVYGFHTSSMFIWGLILVLTCIHSFRSANFCCRTFILVWQWQVAAWWISNFWGISCSIDLRVNWYHVNWYCFYCRFWIWLVYNSWSIHGGTMGFHNCLRTRSNQTTTKCIFFMF